VEPRARQLLAQLLPQGTRDIDLTIVGAGKESLEKVASSLLQVGMFTSARAVWIRGWSFDAAAGDELLALLGGGLPKGATLLVTCPAIDQRSRLYKWFAAREAVEDLSIGVDKRGRLRDDELDAFIRRRIGEAGMPAPAANVVALIRERAGTDLGSVAQEVDKLCVACADRAAITPADVRTHVRDQAGAWVFDLTNALSERRLDRAVALLTRLLEQGEPPIRLLAVLATHVSDLLEAARVLPAIPRAALRNAGAFTRDYFPKLPEQFRNRFKSGFRAYYVLQGATAFTVDELRKLHSALVRTDLALKSSRVPPQHLLVEILEQTCVSRSM
jgi:DNA polymerase-3 subunit delta